MQITVEFRCPKCGLLSPGMADVPEAEDPRRKLTLSHECFHCDEPLEETKRLGEWLKIDSGQMQ